MRFASLLLAVVTMLAVGSRAMAQDATPSGEGTLDGTPIVLPTGLPVTPDPAECTVAAPTIDEVLTRAATPVAGTPDAGDAADASASPAAFVLPTGEPAAEATVAEITALLREVLACLNSGNYLVLFAFVTDDLVAEFLAEPFTDEEVEFLRGTPPALAPEQYGTLVAVREVTLLPDGRVGALVDTIFPEEEPGVQTDYFVFEEVAGRWLIDQIVEDLEGSYPPAEPATPAAQHDHRHAWGEGGR